MAVWFFVIGFLRETNEIDLVWILPKTLHSCQILEAPKFQLKHDNTFSLLVWEALAVRIAPSPCCLCSSFQNALSHHLHKTLNLITWTIRRLQSDWNKKCGLKRSYWVFDASANSWKKILHKQAFSTVWCLPCFHSLAKYNSIGCYSHNFGTSQELHL